jgi:hypothetical protein
MDDDRNRRVQSRAYALWEQEGRPHGRHEEHWRQAEQEMGDNGDAGTGAMAPGSGQVASEDAPMAQPGAQGTGGIGSDVASASGGSGGGLGGMMGGDQASNAGAASPGGAKALRGGPQQGAAELGGSDLGSPAT